jgi:hypothetical protein
MKRHQRFFRLGSFRSMYMKNSVTGSRLLMRLGYGGLRRSVDVKCTIMIDDGCKRSMIRAVEYMVKNRV